MGFADGGGKREQGAGSRVFWFRPLIPTAATDCRRGRAGGVCVVQAHASEFNHAQTQLKRAHKSYYKICAEHLFGDPLGQCHHNLFAKSVMHKCGLAVTVSLVNPFAATITTYS